MLKSLRRLFGRRDESIYDTVDRLNAESHGGRPSLVPAELGTLPIPSRSITLQDPQLMPDGLVIPQLASDRARFNAQLLRYPNGVATVASLQIAFAEHSDGSTEQLAGEIGIDSAKVVIADTEQARTHWTETGPDRIGVISTARNQKLHKQLKKRFKLKTEQINAVRAQTIDPVSEELEREIEEYLQSFPEFAKFTFMYFYVQTNNSFDRVNFTDATWQNLPIGNSPEPMMFACCTGRGDGVYSVHTAGENDLVQSVRVTFIEELTE